MTERRLPPGARRPGPGNEKQGTPRRRVPATGRPPRPAGGRVQSPPRRRPPEEQRQRQPRLMPPKAGQQQRRRPPQPQPVRKPKPPRRPKPPRTFKLGTSSRRLRVGFLLIAIIGSVFAGRLIEVQGVQAAKYSAMATTERLHGVTLHASRGEISDATGKPLATTVDTVALTADPKLTRAKAAQIAAVLSPLLKVPAATLTPKLAKKNTRFVYLARHVSRDVWNKVRDRLSKQKLFGVFSEPDPLRTYPSKNVAASIVGFVGSEGNGLGGLEYALDKQLKGKDGKAQYEIDAAGRRIPLATNSSQAPVPGANVRLTIDRDVQWAAQRAIAEQVRKSKAVSGDVVVIDTTTSEIIALATAPTYDPNEAGKAKAANRANRPLTDMYEPGSVMKVLTAAALVDAGYVDASTKIKLPSRLPRNGKSIGDWWGHGTIDLTFAGALARSSNIGTVLAAERMPKAEQRAYLEKFGIGKAPGTGFPGESSGLLPSLGKWSDLQRATISFGQGVAVSAVQIASGLATVANDGVRIPPTLVKGYVDDKGVLTPAPAPKSTRVVSKEAANAVALMMEQVVQGDGALAKKAAIPGYRVAGKTGTAQKADPTCGCYRGYTASFGGFAPADNPRFVVYVALQDPQGDHSGASNGAPVFHDVMSFALQKYGVPPTGSKTPELPLKW